jgi:hypothetical protein
MFVEIYREDGTLLFTADSAEFTVVFGGNAIFKPGIYQTEQGTKMILTKRDDSWNIYSLCGTLPSMLSNIVANDTKNPYPNPTSNSITIPYTLPEGTSYASLIIVDSQGRELRNFKVDKNFNNLILNTNELEAGNYLYYLESEKGILSSKKFIKL